MDYFIVGAVSAVIVINIVVVVLEIVAMVNDREDK